MQDILLSYIVPMQNSVEYIKQCLDSIECQGISKDHYEIIVIDDGSSDGCGDIASIYDNVVYYRQDNQGQSVARNKGIDIARGTYLCFVDSDDALVDNSMSLLLDIALKENVDVLTYGMTRCTAENMKLVVAHKTNTVSSLMSGYEYIDKFDFNNGPCWYLLRKAMLGELRFEAGRYAEDGMFTMAMLMKAKSIIHVDNECYYYVQRPSSTTTKRDVAHIAKTVADYYYAYDYMQKLIEAKKNELSKKGLERCLNRSLTYIFFGAVRLLYLPHNNSRYWYEKLKDEKLLPINPPYPGLRYKLTCFVLNNYYVFAFVRLLMSNYFLFKNR